MLSTRKVVCVSVVLTHTYFMKSICSHTSRPLPLGLSTRVGRLAARLVASLRSPLATISRSFFSSSLSSCQFAQPSPVWAACEGCVVSSSCASPQPPAASMTATADGGLGLAEGAAHSVSTSSGHAPLDLCHR